MKNSSQFETYYVNFFEQPLSGGDNSWYQNQYLTGFLLLFLLRYVRVIVNFYGNISYRQTPIPNKPNYHAWDVTVVIPTTTLVSATLHRVLKSTLAQPIAKLILATAGPKAKEQEEAFKASFSDTRIIIIHCDNVSRREQTAQAMRQVKTSLVILQDDHTYWPTSSLFLTSIIAPFEDPQTGGVSATIQARHRQHSISLAGFCNFLGMTYLARRAHDYCGTYVVDGGISTLSGRFGVFRTAIYGSKEFLHGYLNELIFFGRVGPLNVDDDKFHTRWLINHGWKIKLQANAESTLSTELGEWPKYNEQILRWTRTTWRSNPRQLLNRKTWTRHPYTSLNLLMWFFRVSLFQEGGMFWLLRGALKHANKLEYFAPAAAALVGWIISLKVLKLVPHLREHSGDIVYIPAYLVFGYWCSLVKIWALVTCWNASWGTATAVNVQKEQMTQDKPHSASGRKIMTAILISGNGLGDVVGKAGRARTRLKSAKLLCS